MYLHIFHPDEDEPGQLILQRPQFNDKLNRIGLLSLFLLLLNVKDIYYYSVFLVAYYFFAPLGKLAAFTH